MKKVIKIYRTSMGDLQVRIPRYMAQEINLAKESHLEIENIKDNKIILKKVEKKVKKSVDI